MSKHPFLALAALLFLAPVLPAQTNLPQGVYVVSPGGNRQLPNQANVEGQAIYVLWSRVDNNIIMNWGPVDSQISIWSKVGKKTALIVWLASLGPFTAIPQYVLDTLPPTVRCMSNGVKVGPVPDYLSPEWQTPALRFVGELLDHYGNDSRIGYIRIGPLMGGESSPSCLAEMEEAYGMNQPDLETYVDSFLLTESQHMGSVPVMVALNCYNPCSEGDYDYPHHIADTAAAYGIGIGQEALQPSDITNYNDGNPTIADWANIFAEYPQCFRELQFNPGADWDARLLLPFAGERGAGVVEMDSTSVTNPLFQQVITNFDEKSAN